MKIKTMTRMALLSAIALTIFWVEAQIPMPISVPGVKLGLANVVTVYAVFSLGAWEAGGILLVRVLLGSLFTGQMMSLLYSAVGGVLALLTALGLKRILTGTQIWVASCFSAVAHNLGRLPSRLPSPGLRRSCLICQSFWYPACSPASSPDSPPRPCSSISIRLGNPRYTLQIVGKTCQKCKENVSFCLWRFPCGCGKIKALQKRRHPICQFTSAPA